MCSFAYKADYAQYVLTSLCQEKQQEQATHSAALLYLNTHLVSALSCTHHCKGWWSHHGTQHKDIVPETRGSKEQQGHTLYFNSLILGLTIRQAGPDAMVGLDDFPHIHARTYDHSAIVLLFREWVVGSFTWLLGNLVIPVWPLVSGLIPHPQEKKDPYNTYEAFVLPVSLQLRIIVSFRCRGPVICHPLSPKGGYVSPQVVCVCDGEKGGWGANDSSRFNKECLYIDVNTDLTSEVTIILCCVLRYAWHWLHPRHWGMINQAWLIKNRMSD